MSSVFAPLSEWVPAALLRLAIYPAGLWVLFALLVFHFAGGRTPGTLRLWAGELARSPLPVALAWVALALLPLSGIAVLPFAPQTFSIVVLLVASLVTQAYAVEGRASIRPLHFTATLLLAALSLALTIYTQEGVLQPLTWSVSVAGLVCVWALGKSEESRSLSGDLRLLTWLGLLLAPLLNSVSANSGTGALAWSAAAYLVLVAIAGLARRLRPVMADNTAALICWGLAALSLLVVLV